MLRSSFPHHPQQPNPNGKPLRTGTTSLGCLRKTQRVSERTFDFQQKLRFPALQTTHLNKVSKTPNKTQVWLVNHRVRPKRLKHSVKAKNTQRCCNYLLIPGFLRWCMRQWDFCSGKELSGPIGRQIKVDILILPLISYVTAIYQLIWATFLRL